MTRVWLVSELGRVIHVFAGTFEFILLLIFCYEVWHNGKYLDIVGRTSAKSLEVELVGRRISIIHFLRNGIVRNIFVRLCTKLS